MKLSVTLEAPEAKRLLELAWIGTKFNTYDSPFEHGDQKADRQLLERFRAECESAKGSKL